MAAVLTMLGIHGVLGIIGLYLLIGSALGRLPPIPKVMTAEMKIERRAGRWAIAVIGVVLAIPIVVTAYREIGWGAHTVIIAPETEEFVAPAEVGMRNVSWGLPEKNRLVEAFGLLEHDRRCLKYALFQNNVCVSIDMIPEGLLEIGTSKRAFTAEKGYTMSFTHQGREYRLVVTQVWLAYAGPSKAQIEIRESE